jgi:repressor LexA
MKKISDAKERIFQFIQSEQDRNGYPPTVREICDAVGLASPASVHRYLKQLIDEGRISSDPNKKRSYSASVHRSGSVPLLGKVAAGLPISAEENREDEFPIPSLLLHQSESDAFMLRVSGESMKDAGIHSNDIIVVEQGIVPNDGDIVVARIDGEDVTVKRFYHFSDTEIELRPENEAFSVMRYTRDRVEIIGCVTGLMRSY